VHPKIAGDDRLIIWSGGMWDWLDPLSLIRAMKILQPNHPELKLYFMGTRHPNPILKGMEMPERAMELSKELGLFDQTVFFGDWAPYDERQSYLLEADLSVITHPDTIETHFSYRTRLLDCLWAKIPVVVSEGDTFADLVVQEGLGVTVPSTPMKTVGYTQSKTANGEGQGDEAKALAQGIEKVLREIQKGGYRDNFERVRERFRWGRTAQPLIAFCQEPSMAVDKGEYQTAVEKLRRDKDAFLEQVVKDKDAYYLAIIQRYQNSLPLRAYYRMKRLLRIG
jgi:glycosyltransferase involved in cell wall biosynthesis